MKSLGEIKIAYYYSEHLGPRFQSAGITLQLNISDTYKFIPKVKWNSGNYTKAVESGILDGLNDIGYDKEKGIKIELIDCIDHHIYSSTVAFYTAARTLIRSRKDLFEIISSYNKGNIQILK
jgi:hypothetical protein